MNIDPKWPFWIGLVTTVALVGANGSVWTGILPDTMVNTVSHSSNLLGTLGTAMLTFLTGASSNAKGPLAK